VSAIHSLLRKKPMAAYRVSQGGSNSRGPGMGSAGRARAGDPPSGVLVTLRRQAQQQPLLVSGRRTARAGRTVARVVHPLNLPCRTVPVHRLAHG